MGFSVHRHGNWDHLISDFHVYNAVNGKIHFRLLCISDFTAFGTVRQELIGKQ